MPTLTWQWRGHCWPRCATPASRASPPTASSCSGRICERFLDAFVARVKSLKVGEFSEPGVEIGPLIDEAAVRHALGLVEDAVSRGARVLCGGRRLERKGFFFEPTVLAEVPATRCAGARKYSPRLRR